MKTPEQIPDTGECHQRQDLHADLSLSCGNEASGC